MSARTTKARIASTQARIAGLLAWKERLEAARRDALLRPEEDRCRARILDIVRQGRAGLPTVFSGAEAPPRDLLEALHAGPGLSLADTERGLADDREKLELLEAALPTRTALEAGRKEAEVLLGEIRQANESRAAAWRALYGALAPAFITALEAAPVFVDAGREYGVLDGRLKKLVETLDLDLRSGSAWRPSKEEKGLLALCCAIGAGFVADGKLSAKEVQRALEQLTPRDTEEAA